MRKCMTIAATAVLSLVLAGVALADFSQSSNIVLTAPASRARRGAGSAGKCTAQHFVVKSHFVYTDGSQTDLQSSSPCR